MQKITTFLWFDNQAEQAAEFYCSVFKNSKINAISHYSEEVAKVAGMPAGSVLSVSFELDGQTFGALNGGPMFKFSEAISLMVHCETQAELDEFWAKLSAGGEESQCGWLKDRYGLSWQIVPAKLEAWLTDVDTARSGRVMDALMPMKKLDIEALENAYEGVGETAAR